MSEVKIQHVHDGHPCVVSNHGHEHVPAPDNSEWAEAGKRHDPDDGGHWHEPSYPSCVVCRMRDLEQALTKIVNGWMSDTDTLDDVKDAINDAIELLSPTKETHECGWHGHCPKPAGHDGPHIPKRIRDTETVDYAQVPGRLGVVGPARNPGLLT